MPPSPTPATSLAPAAFKQMGLASAVAIGIGGMVGGVYAIFGSAAKVSRLGHVALLPGWRHGCPPPHLTTPNSARDQSP